MKNVQTDRQTDRQTDGGTHDEKCRVHVSLYPQTISGQRHINISNLTATFNDTHSSIYAIYTCKLIVL